MPDRAVNPRNPAAAERDARHPGWARLRRLLKAIFTPVALVVAILYFLIDGIVLSLLQPLMRRLAEWPPVARLMRWVATLGPYPTLALILIPIVVLEPLKPAAFYLMAKRHVATGTMLLVATEVVKIAAVERLFRLSLPKLLSIPLFARVYTFVAGWVAYLEALPPWRFVQRRAAQIKALSRRLAAFLRD